MRITGGTHRSRALRAPRGTTTRPTTDRVREALFGILTSAGAVNGARVLDLYAGTGALGLEALSRGAAHATLVESSREAIAVIRANTTSLKLEGSAQLLACDAREAVRRLGPTTPFDVVFADPPWKLVDSGEAGAVLGAIVGAGLLSGGGILVLEHSARTPAPGIDALETGATRRYGDTALTFYKPAGRSV